MRRRALTLGLLLFATVAVFSSAPVAAWGCIGPKAMLHYHGDEMISFVGVVRHRDGDVARLSVSQWLAGAGQANHVTVDDSYRHEAGRLPMGVEYVVTAMPFDPPRDVYFVGDCQLAAPLSSTEGRRFLRLIEEHYALPQTDTDVATGPDFTFALLGAGLAGGVLASALLRRRRALM